MFNKSVLSILLVAVLLISGCAHYSFDLGAFTGFGIKDLEKARSDGETKTVTLSYYDAFTSIEEILKNNNIKIYQKNISKGYIVAMGFHKQVDTTRVGIFVDYLSENETEITLSSLSSTALAKAKAIIFGGLEK